MASYQSYSDTSDSGIDWLGDIPSHWETIPVGRLFNRTKRTNQEKKELLSVYRDYGVIPKSSRDDNNNKPSEDLSPYQLVRENDLVMNKMKAWQGSIAISEYEGIVSPAYFVYEPKSKLFEYAHPKYVHYLLRNPIYIAQYLRQSKGIRVNQWDLDPDEFQRIELLLPTKHEQQQIYNFLDHETAKIDTLIDKQQQLIKLLKEKRQAVISHAVTKGLDPNAPMRDSSVEWLGEVPSHWKIVKLSYFLKLLSGDGITSNQIEPEGKYPVMGGNGLRGFTTNYNCNGEYALIGRQGALCGNINIAKGKFFATEHAVVVYPYINFNLTFLSEFLRFMNLGQYSVSAAQPGISVERINGLIIAIPPLQEQMSIGGKIEDYSDMFDALTAKAKTMITVLKERRTALISAAVTGKIDVRNWRPPQVESTAEAV
ncbi:restriction endonuclease subunit S [Endozoicomonas sp.]|nr:restriction endonuclease subunit S [Endozoicomonas sp.]